MNHDFMNNIPKNGVAADVRRRISLQYHAFVRLLTSAATTLAVVCACQGQPTNATGQLTTIVQPIPANGAELSWPRQFEDNGVQVSIFQPQIEKWEGSDFETRSAVAVTQGSNAPIYGVFWMKARAGWREKAQVELSGPDGGPLG